MSTISNLPASQGYCVGGYKPGDHIGAGLVLDPATAVNKADTKLVTVDSNRNGQTDPQEEQLLVQLPPKGFGLDHYDKTKAPIARAVDFGLVSLIPATIFGIQAGAIADAGWLGSALATTTGTNRVMLATGIAITVSAIAIGYFTQKSALTEYSNRARLLSVPDLVQPKNTISHSLTP